MEVRQQKINEMLDRTNVLLFAHPKTGQHWILFIVANYQRLINLKPKITWKEILLFARFTESIKKSASSINYNSETVNFVRIEYSYTHNINVRNFIDSFDKRIYLYRNPYDVMISMFYYFHTDPKLIKEIREKKDFKNYKFFEDYVKEKIDIYCAHIKSSIDYADLVLYYDDLLEDTSPFRILLGYFYDELYEPVYQKTLEVSSFKYVNNMEKILKKDKILNKGRKNVIFHARNGRSGQYYELMNDELIDYITEKWEKLKKNVEYKLK